MIYFDNAATGGFKPYSVQEATCTVIKHLCVNPTRSGHRLAERGAEMIYRARRLLQVFFNAPQLDRVIFTKNCTEALNTAIFGLLQKGDHVVTTCMEHNSVLRPLWELKRRGAIEFDVVYPKESPFITQKHAICYDDVEPFIRRDTRLVITNQASNVTGATADVVGIARGLKTEHPNVIYMVDGAQSAGHIAIDMACGIDVLCLAGHKGLCGIMGSGALIFGDTDISPLTFGGTGSDSFAPQPTYYPECLESGTLNLPAIVALYEGVMYVKNHLDFTGEQLVKMTERLINGLKTIGVRVFSHPNAIGIASFEMPNISSTECAEKLSALYDVAVRGGFHCAPLMHKYLKTEKGGLVRASLCNQNTFREIDLFLSFISELLKN